MSEFDYDLFVIGGGSGGVRAARIAATHGARVGIAEEFRYGGTCVIRGCVPKKLFVYASKFSEEFEDAEGFGWTVGERHFAWDKLIAAKDQEITRLEGLYRRNLDRTGVESHDSRAVIEGPNTVRLLSTGQTITAKYILVAVGASPNVDTSLPGGEHVITSNEAFNLSELPQKAVVAGGGYIAVEFAGIFNGLGVDTTLIYRGPEILRGFDMDLRVMVREEMEKKGIKLVLNDTFDKIEKRADGGLVGHTKSGTSLEADQIMFAIGRNPHTRELGLEKAGVEMDGIGAIKVSADSKTNVDSIYAVGDVTNRANLTPVAIREGHAFADTVFGNKPWTVDHSLIATAVFSQPELGTVGLTQEQALEKTPNLDIYKSSFRPMKHTLSGRDEKMLMKMIVDADTQKVLGVHVVGPDAGELAQILGITLQMGATKADFDRTIAVHPTAAEELVTMREPTERLRG
ncbi:glutathione-disulfide reductase [Roseibium denhamense]|uniref:Glutathione reductase n=1 Tax=Roseibium denhamense TaxID=76305 RepID=A0ABY1NW90_9HYPH|nr:glutathione-disulfide reductase [Roseibium denhamense]MTI05448.1 glutathione-disulfide reductase [Roseibium denhamense]SMP18601.1 NADPH-glutathione reductase [Roseibium denhamense]